MLQGDSIIFAFHSNIAGGVVAMDESCVDAAPDTAGQSSEPEPTSDHSSATEGPDTPDISASPSPVPMMLPSDSQSPYADFPPPKYSVK